MASSSSSPTPAVPAVIDPERPIKEIARLAMAATGIDVVEIKPPVGDAGLPPSIPVGIVHGERPMALSLRDLFEPYRTAPATRTGTARALTLEAFIDLVNRHKLPETAVFADTTWTAPRFTAVLDYHAADPAGEAANGKHRVTYAFPLSEEWKLWVEGNGKSMSQGDFAAFLEDRIAELCSPSEAEVNTLARDFNTTIATPSQLIQLSRGLQVNVNEVVKNAVTLDSGETQVVFEQTHQGTDGRPLKVPGLFILNVAPFFGGERIHVPVRLRYRTTGGKLTWFYQLYRPDLAINERVKADLVDVADETGLPTFEAHPEMAA